MSQRRQPQRIKTQEVANFTFFDLVQTRYMYMPIKSQKCITYPNISQKIPKIGQNMSLNVFYALLFIHQHFVYIFSHNQYNHQIASINLTPTQDTIWIITILSTDC